MRITQGHVEVLALLGHTVTNTVDLQLLLIALGNTDDHVVEQGAGQAVQAAMLLSVGGTGDIDHTGLDVDLHLGVQIAGQLALGALNSNNVAALHFHGNTGGNSDRHSTNTTHSVALLTK